MRRFGTAVAALVLALGAAACSDSESDDDGGGDGASSDKRQEYVDAVTSSMATAEISEDDSRCFAGALVDATGVDELEERGTPEELAASDTAFEDLGLGEAEAESAYEELESCVDAREFLIQIMVSGQEMSDEATACIEERVDDDAARAFFVTVFRGAEGQQDDEAMQDLSATLMECGTQ